MKKQNKLIKDAMLLVKKRHNVDPEMDHIIEIQCIGHFDNLCC